MDTLKLRERKMELIFLLDTSNSMRGERIIQLNNTMLETLCSISESEKCDSTNVRVISFNNIAKYFIGSIENSIDARTAYNMWQNLVHKGATDTAHALRLCNKAIESDIKRGKTDKTIVILVTDGKSSDHDDFIKAYYEMKSLTQNIKDKIIIFVAIGVKDYDEAELYQFADLGNTATLGNNDMTALVYKIDEISDLSEIIMQIISHN